MDLHERLTAALDRTETYVRQRDYRGFDPYDGLMMPCWQWPGLRTWRGLRWAWQQTVKRCPFDLRPALGIRPGRNPVTLALCLQAFAYRDRAAGGNARAAERARLVADLDRLVTPGWSGPCWGYDFFWEGRFASAPPYHPTVVATGFVCQGLYEDRRLGGGDLAVPLVRGAADFVTRDLNRTETADGFCWSYSPTDRQAVLNATLKGARICAQAHSLGGRPDLADLARTTARFVAGRQNADGTWPYSVSDDRTWADNFHTGYVLECLDDVARLTGQDDAVDAARERGLDAYVSRFFADGVVPRYYADRTWPVDATACGQSLLTLVRFGRIEQACEVAAWCLDHLALPDGGFKYQIGRFRENRQVFLRWSVAWMLLGLSRIELALARGE